MPVATIDKKGIAPKYSVPLIESNDTNSTKIYKLFTVPNSDVLFVEINLIDAAGNRSISYFNIVRNKSMGYRAYVYNLISKVTGYINPNNGDFCISVPAYNGFGIRVLYTQNATLNFAETTLEGLEVIEIMNLG